MQNEFKLKSNPNDEDNTSKEIYLRGKNLADGYLEPNSLKCVGFKNGWFNTSDIGYLENNKLFLKGRSDNQINIGGRKLSAEKIEREAMLLHFIHDILIFSVDDSVFGEKIAAIIVFNNNDSVSESVNKLIKFFKGYPDEQFPKIVWIAKNILLSDNGKKVRDRKRILSFAKNLKQII